MFKQSSQFLAILSLIIFAFTTVNAATVNTFTNRTSWEVAVGGFQTETFNDRPLRRPIPNNTVFDLGLFNLFYTNSGGLDEFGNGIFSGGSINGTQEVGLSFDFTGNGTTTLMGLRFDEPISAFGATWNGITPSQSLTINVIGETITIHSLLGPASLQGFNNPTGDGGFMGFTSDTTFSSFIFTADGRLINGDENFQFDDVVLSSTNPVPIPSSLPLFATGLTSLIGWRWWSKKIAYSLYS